MLFDRCLLVGCERTFFAAPLAGIVVSESTLAAFGDTEVQPAHVVSGQFFHLRIHQRGLDDGVDLGADDKAPDGVFGGLVVAERILTHKALEQIAAFLPILATHVFQTLVLEPGAHFSQYWAGFTPHFHAGYLYHHLLAVCLTLDAGKRQADHGALYPKECVLAIAIGEETQCGRLTFLEIPVGEN